MRKIKLRQSAAAGGLSFLSIMFAIAMMAGTTLGQSATGQIVGKVTDPNGAVVVGAKMRLPSNGNGRLRPSGPE